MSGSDSFFWPRGAGVLDLENLNLSKLNRKVPENALSMEKKYHLKF